MKNTQSFIFEKDSKLIFERSQNAGHHVALSSDGTKEERMARFMADHARKSAEVKARIHARVSI